MSVALWEEMSLSGWKNTSIIIIFDTNANPFAMLAICGWSGRAEITEENGHKWNANSLWATSGSPPSAQLGGPLGSHTASLCLSQGAAGILAAGSEPAAGTQPSHWLVFVCLGARYSFPDLNICKCCKDALWKETPTTMLSSFSSLFIFPALFLFVSFLTAASSAPCGNQLWRVRSALSQGFI